MNGSRLQRRESLNVREWPLLANLRAGDRALLAEGVPAVCVMLYRDSTDLRRGMHQQIPWMPPATSNQWMVTGPGPELQDRMSACQHQPMS